MKVDIARLEQIANRYDPKKQFSQNPHGMRIGFIQPKIPDGNYLPNLGIMYLASVLLQKGFTVKVFDENLSDNVLDEVIAYQPKVVGITAVTAAIHSSAKLASDIKKSDAGVITLVGGPHVFALPKETLQKFPSFDFGFCGESEQTILSFCEAIQKEGSVLSALETPGLVFRKADGEVVQNKATQFLSHEQLEELLFPAWHLLPMEQIFKKATHGLFSKGKRIMPVMTTRGCPNYCAFCCRVMGFAFRKESVEKVLAEILWLYQTFKIDEVYFEDDTFTQEKERALAILDGVKQLNLPIYIKFANGLRADKVDRELLLAMKAAGVYWVGFGIESGSNATLELMHKKLDLDRARENVQLAKELGLKVGSNCIIGFPGETKQSIRESVEYFLSLKLDSFAVVTCVPFPGTTAWQICKKNGWFTERAKEYYNYWFEVFKVNPLIETPFLSAKELSWEIKRVYFRFYLFNFSRFLLIARMVWKKVFLRFTLSQSLRFLRSNSRSG